MSKKNVSNTSITKDLTVQGATIMQGATSLQSTLDLGDNEITSLKDAVADQDAVNLRSLEARLPQSRWARIFNGETTPTIGASNGVTGIVRNSAGVYTVTLTNPLTSASPEVMIDFVVVNETGLNRTLMWSRGMSTATSIRFETLSATAIEDTDNFIISIVDLEL